MQKKISLVGSTLLGLVIPLQTLAYFTPEEVLLSREFFLPPTAREAQDRAQQQVIRSSERREREHSVLEYYPTASNESLDAELFVDTADIADPLKTAAPSLENLSEREQELLRAIHLIDARQERLLTRIEENQFQIQYYGGNRLHGGAPPLAPTGAGGMLAAITMIGAVFWTIRQAKKAGRVTKTVA